MENRDQEVKYCALFHNHYGALMFKKKMGDECVLKPVPRSLSSSCGTAAFFPNWKEGDYINLDRVYKIEKDGFVLVYEEK